MQRIKDTNFYGEVLKEVNYYYGNFYFFEHCLVSEINQDVLFDWELAKPPIQEAVEFYKNSGEKIIYISNRVNDYTVQPADWLKFIKYSFKLAGYGIVTNSKLGAKNAVFESLFIPTRFKVFNHFVDAMLWAATIDAKVNKAKKV